MKMALLTFKELSNGFRRVIRQTGTLQLPDFFVLCQGVHGTLLRIAKKIARDPHR